MFRYLDRGQETRLGPSEEGEYFVVPSVAQSTGDGGRVEEFFGKAPAPDRLLNDRQTIKVAIGPYRGPAGDDVSNEIQPAQGSVRLALEKAVECRILRVRTDRSCAR